MSNSNIAVVYFSGYGHTKVVAETFANEINAQLIQMIKKVILLSKIGRH